MGKYKTIQEDIENVTNKEVVKQTRISGVAIGLIVAGGLCAVAGKGFEDPNSSIPTFLFTLASFLFLAGIIKLFISRSYYTFKPTKSRIKKMTLYFDIHETDALQTCFEMKRFEELARLKREKDTGVRLEAMVAGDGKFAAVQISEYIPYNYEAVTPVLCYYGQDAKMLADYCKA